MTAKPSLLETITLSGLEIAPSQVCGAIRLVPLIRRNAPGDLRLARRPQKDDLTIVSLDGPLLDPGIKYMSYVPQGMIVSWSDDGSPVAARGTQMDESEGKLFKSCGVRVRVLPRMAKRMAGNQLRFLPMHLAMEGFLSLHFAGPDIAWTEYSRQALRTGLDPRSESAYGGEQIAGFENALRTFEIHENQSGILVFVADALASAFVVPTPEDYRALHRSMLSDFYGELIYQYGLLYDTVMPLSVTIDASQIKDLIALRRAVSQVRREWGEFQGFMAGDLLGRSITSERIYQAGHFTLQRFMTDLDPAQENHIGEAIVRDDGTLEYLKTFRLSGAQTRRAYLLRQLASANWNLDDAATLLQTTREQLVHRMEKAGFGYLLMESVRIASDKYLRSLGRTPKRDFTGNGQNLTPDAFKS